MKKITTDFFEKIDIIEVVSEVVQLKKVGSQYRGLCPFHNEKNPSFYVSPIGVYHCFGCGESGNAIKFVMKIYGYDYEEAIEYLARKFNIDINEVEDKNYELYKLNEYASEFYFENLKKNENVINYLKERGLNDKSIIKFRIGYADSSNEIIKFLIDRGFGTELLFKLGLAYRDYNGNIKPFFINRIMFPIFSTSGKYILGFSGRSIDSSEPKYKNSQDSVIFKKSQTIYAFNFSKSSIVKNKFVIVVEGFFDVILLHQYGYENTIAFMGTNISDYQAQFIKKYVDKIYLFFDNDSSGQKAIIRNLDKILNANLIPYIILPDSELDPDELVLKGGVDFYIKNPYNLNDYFKKLYEKQEKIEDKMKIITEFREVLNNVKITSISSIFVEEMKPILDELYKNLKLKINLKEISDIDFNDEVYALWSVYKDENYKSILNELSEDVFYSEKAKKLFNSINSNFLNDDEAVKLISNLEFREKSLSERTIKMFINKWIERKFLRDLKKNKNIENLENIIKIKRRL